MPLSLGDKKRRHHYVWQHYLRAWTKNDQITSWRKGTGIFKSNTINVAVAKDFYRLRDLSQEDIDLVDALCVRNAPDGIKPILRDWIMLLTGPFALRRNLESAGINVSEGEGAETFEIAVSNLEEDLHGEIETGAIGYLDALRNNDLQFLNCDDDVATFLHFLVVQFFRTRRQRETVLESLRGFKGLDVEKTWNVMSHLFATTMAYTLHLRVTSMRFTLLCASQEAYFITTDQPVINLDAVDLPKDAEATSLTLYYPVAPQSALLVEIGQAKRESILRAITAEEVGHYNRLIFSQLLEQAFGEEEDLLRLAASGSAS